MQRCGGCKHLKEETDFEVYKNIRRKQCIACREKSKKYYHEHTDYFKKQRKKFRDDNPEYSKKYYHEHTDYFKNHHLMNREKRKRINPLHLKFIDMIHHSKIADNHICYDDKDYINEPYLLELWYTQNHLCYHCQCEMTLDFGVNPKKISIQRLNNDLPHIQTNCVLSCMFCNLSHMERIT